MSTDVSDRALQAFALDARAASELPNLVRAPTFRSAHLHLELGHDSESDVDRAVQLVACKVRSSTPPGPSTTNCTATDVC